MRPSRRGHGEAGASSAAHACRDRIHSVPCSKLNVTLILPCSAHPQRARAQAGGRGGRPVLGAVRILGRGGGRGAGVQRRGAVHTRRRLAGRRGRAAHRRRAAPGWHRAPPARRSFFASDACSCLFLPRLRLPARRRWQGRAAAPRAAPDSGAAQHEQHVSCARAGRIVCA